MHLMLRKAGIIDDRIYQAISFLSRTNFLPVKFAGLADEDINIEIFENIFASKTSEIAKMIHLGLSYNHNTKTVLEIGTGSGWQTYILSTIYDRVYTIEIDEIAFDFTNKIFKNINNRIVSKLGDGKEGWIESAPYDAIYIDSCCDVISKNIYDQLNKDNGVLVYVKEFDKKQYFYSFSTNGNLSEVKSQFEVQRTRIN